MDKPPEDDADLEETKRIMERLVRTPPKPHKEKAEGKGEPKPTRKRKPKLGKGRD